MREKAANCSIDSPGAAYMNKQDIEKYLRMLGQELLHLKLSNAQDALALVKMYVPEQLLVPRIEYIIDEIFE